jgi:hypothetical protein
MKTESPNKQDNTVRDQPKFRRLIGSVFIALVWILYGVRLIWGIGPAHDYQGRQAPAFHYLAAALIVTGLVVVWIAVGAIMARRQSSSEQPPKGNA